MGSFPQELRAPQHVLLGVHSAQTGFRALGALMGIPRVTQGIRGVAALAGVPRCENPHVGARASRNGFLPAPPQRIPFPLPPLRSAGAAATTQRPSRLLEPTQSGGIPTPTRVLMRALHPMSGVCPEG